MYLLSKLSFYLIGSKLLDGNNYMRSLLSFLLMGGVPLTLLLSILTNSLHPDLISLQSETIYLKI